MGDAAAKKKKKKKKKKARPPLKPQRSTAPVQAAATGTVGTGNTIDFQFAEYQMVTADFVDRELVLTPTLPKKLEKIWSKYIYVFELGPRFTDKNPLLAKEYQADKNGALSFIDGPKRRFKEPAAANSWISAKAVSLPLAKNGTPVRYAFVVARGRFSAATILNMENGLHPTYHPMYLGDPQYFKQGDDKAWYVPVVDPLTFGEQLRQTYLGALIDFTNYTIPNDENAAKKAEVENRNARFQLARMIKDTLLAPEGGQVTDPLHVCGHMKKNGQPLMDEILKQESALRRKSSARRTSAEQLVRFMRSGLFGTANDWYLGPQSNKAEIGHFWIDVFGRSLDRLGETPEGKQFIYQLLNLEKAGDPSKNWLQYLFHPEEGSEPHAMERWLEIYPIARKAATGVVLGICEMAPALIVFKKVRAANNQIVLTLKAFIEHVPIDVEFAAIGPGGFVQGVLRYEMPVPRLQIDWEKADPKVGEWLDKGKGKWPDDTKLAEKSELLGRLFIGVEAINFFNKLSEMIDLFNKQPAADHVRKDCFAAECVAAVLDFVVACEEPILHFAHQFAHGAVHGATHGGHAAGAASHLADAEGAAAISVGKKQAKSLFGKAFSGPVLFKALGAASAAIDAVVYFIEAREAAEKGDTGVSVGNYLISGGSALMAVASVMNAAGYIATASAVASDGALFTGAFLGAAGATLLVVGVAIVMAGFIVVALFTKTAWQKFIEHTPWGNSAGEEGWDTWSGGNFETWKQNKKGYEKQIHVLTAMLCAYRVHGDGQDPHSITISFGSIPPNALVEVYFSFGYVDDERRELGYEIDLETRKVTNVYGDAKHFLSSGSPVPPRELRPFWMGDRLSGLGIFAPKLVRASVNLKYASCELVLKYAPGSGHSPIMTGTIPVKGMCKYKILEDGTRIHFDELNSLDIGEEPKKHKAGEKKEKEEDEADETNGEKKPIGAADSSHAE